MRSSTTSKKMSPGMKFFFSRIFPLIFVIIGGIVSFFGITNVIQAKDSESWPKANGVILSSSVESQRSHSNKGGSTTTYSAKILYKFNIKKAEYSGTKVAYGDYGSSDHSHAGEIVSRYPKSKKVTVYYNPASPKECVLEPGLKGQAFFLPGVGIVFFVAGMLMAIFLPRALNKQE